MNRYRLILLLIALCIVLPGRAQSQSQDTATVITMKQAMEMTLANNHEIRKAVLDVESSREEIRQAWGSIMPQISSQASYSRNVEIPVQFVPAQIFGGPEGELRPISFGTDNNWSGGFSARQIIFQGQAFVGISSAELVNSLRDEQLRAVTQQQLTQTRVYYLNALIAEQRLELRKKSLERIRENLEENRKRYEEGLVSEYAVMQLEVQLQNQEPMVEQAKFELNDAYRTLHNHMGVNEAFSFKVKGALSDYNLNQEIQNPENEHIKDIYSMVDLSRHLAVEMEDPKVTEQLINKRADYQLSDYQIQLQEKRIKAEQSRYLPTISTSYNLNWTASQAGTPVFFGTEMTRARSQVISLNISLPIFTGLQRQAAINQAQIQQEKLKVEMQQVKSDASQQIKSLDDRLDQLRSMYMGQKEAVETAREGYRIARQQYRNGVGSQLDVTNAELSLREAQLNFAQTVYQYLSTRAQMDAAIGQVPLIDVNPTTSDS